MAMAAKTWNGNWWRFGGGGNVWHAMAYDAKFNRIYIGTANGLDLACSGATTWRCSL